MKRGGPIRRRKPLRSNAAARADRDRARLASRLDDPDHHDAVAKRLMEQRRRESEWQQAREMVISRSGGWCEGNWLDVCPPGRHRGQHVHHRRLRAQGGSDDLDNLLHLCRRCHEHAHGHPIDAAKRGIIVMLKAWELPSGPRAAI